jgi:tetratricopeptide (TPR) repeat protein
VRWGQNSTDEMGDLWIQVVPKTTADSTVLNDDIGRKTRAEDLAAYSKLLRGDPGNPLRHDAVALLSLQAGLIDQAIAQYRESLKLNADSAPTHYNLGVALSVQRSFEAAVAEFRDALRLDPDYAEAHNNLGALLSLHGSFDEAVAHYHRALTLRPDNVDAHNNLARVLWAQGHGTEAIDEFRKAAALGPDAPAPLAGLAWVRATAAEASMRDAGEAVRLAERAAELTGRRDASVLDTLAAAYASAGRFDQAVATARAAVGRAVASKALDLAAQIRQRLALYQQGKAYRDPTPAL